MLLDKVKFQQLYLGIGKRYRGLDQGKYALITERSMLEAYSPCCPNLECERDPHCIKSHRLAFNVWLIKRGWMESTVGYMTSGVLCSSR